MGESGEPSKGNHLYSIWWVGRWVDEDCGWIKTVGGWVGGWVVHLSSFSYCHW